ncbi:hypothetical protein [Sphaerobacter sp.]|uniref:hypothetical protein n=1 Tax=Sphaerobacter sp. TaxID=2099654 RepID=UPI001DCEDD41|nr:hypothetical protein [Sphaerobacter sp.]MBX5445533.1 hypothetical protein [Sphaerobacter sp.]
MGNRNEPTDLPPVPVRHALAVAARAAGVDPEQVTLLGYEAVTWPDAALGAPEPGRLYAQVLTPGYRVHLRVAGLSLTYHTDHGRRAVPAR